MAKNGKNGKNGKKLNGKNGTTITFTNGEELPPDADNGITAEFQPTLRQAVFRQVAAVLSRKGLYLTQDWIRECDRTENMPKIKVKEWKEWEKDPAFCEWFYGDLPDFCEMTDRDMAFLEMEYWRAVRDGMRGGDSWAVKEFASRRWPKGGEGQAFAAGEADLELTNWIKNGGASAWTRKPAEA